MTYNVSLISDADTHVENFHCMIIVRPEGSIYSQFTNITWFCIQCFDTSQEMHLACKNADQQGPSQYDGDYCKSGSYKRKNKRQKYNTVMKLVSVISQNSLIIIGLSHMQPNFGIFGE